MTSKLSPAAQYRRIKALFEKYERILIPGMLVLGLIVDFITFRSIRVQSVFIVLGVYLVISALAIAYLNLYQEEKIGSRSRFFKYLRLASPLVVQFTFGALLSASLIFYWFSGSFSVSWPLIIVIAFLLISNDTLRHYYMRPAVQISVYYFILFSIFSLILPFIQNSIDPWVFVMAGVASLVVILLYLVALTRVLDSLRKQSPSIIISILLIFGFMNVLYFTNAIPPIPLSIRDAGAYHSVEVEGGVYSVLSEEESTLERFLPGQDVHIKKGSRIYVYTSIFAPAELDTRIVHEWQYYDDESREWMDRDKLSFGIVGGRDDGYRGYSYKSALQEGLWRVNAETERGQVLGRVRFNVEFVDETPELISKIK